MKRLKFKIANLVLILVLVISYADAQITPIDYINQAGRYTIRNRFPPDLSIPYEPYLHLNEKIAKIELMDGTIVEGFFRYNVELESLERSTNDKTYTYEEIAKFWFKESDEHAEEAFVNIRLIWPKSEYGGFFQVIKNSQYVWAKYFLNFVPKNYDPVMDVGDPYDRVVMSKEYYFKLNEQWTTLPSTKSELIKNMEAFVDESELKKFLRKEKIKLDVNEDVGKLVNWIAKNGI